MIAWEEKARSMRAQGYTFAEIAKAVNRCRGRVHHVLSETKYKKKTHTTTPDSEETKRRRLVRRWCRRHAERLGKSVEELYAANGVQDLDLSALWDERNGAN